MEDDALGGRHSRELVALPEEALASACQFGHATLTAPHLKMIPEGIGITDFLGFNALELRDPMQTTDSIAMALIAAAVFVMLGSRLGELL